MPNVLSAPRCCLGRNERGQNLVEYGLLLALLAVIIIIALIFLGPIISRIFQNVGTTLNNV